MLEEVRHLHYVIRRDTINFYLINFHKKPIVLDKYKTMEKIINEKYSIARFGDGEFYLMIGQGGIKKYQSSNELLSERLLEVFNSNQNGLLIGIPNTFDKKQLTFRTEESKKWWNNYLREYRVLWYKYINFNKVYGCTNFTRNYIVVNDKSQCKKYFSKIKEIWEGRDILVVEGRYTRLGVGNDLFNNVKSVQRIICPNVDAFDKYNDILNETKKQSREKLVLIALGPTATILAYDLFMVGFQAVDIGHIDIEYEWFLQGAENAVKVKNKFTHEADGAIDKDDFRNKKYDSEIIAKVF